MGTVSIKRSRRPKRGRRKKEKTYYYIICMGVFCCGEGLWGGGS